VDPIAGLDVFEMPGIYCPGGMFEIWDCLLPFGTESLFPFAFHKYNIKIYRTIIFPVETWSRTLKEEHRLRVFENRVLRNLLLSLGLRGTQ
jgi:hypothetical protein